MEIFSWFLEAEWHTDWADARHRLGDTATTPDLMRTEPQRRADALLAMARAAASTPPGSQPPRATSNVLIDHDTFEAHLRGETRDPADYRKVVCRTHTGRRLHPDDAVNTALIAHIRRVVYDTTGTVIDLGRRSRLFRGSARDAVMLLLTNCVWIGCDQPIHWCDADHSPQLESPRRHRPPQRQRTVPTPQPTQRTRLPPSTATTTATGTPPTPTATPSPDPVGSRVRLDEVGDQDGWRCWLCDEPVDPDMSVNDPRGPSIDSRTTERKAKAKGKGGGKGHGTGQERLAHRSCNTGKGSTKPVIEWPAELFVADPAVILTTVDRLQRKGGREIVGRCLERDDADERRRVDRRPHLEAGTRLRRQRRRRTRWRSVPRRPPSGPLTSGLEREHRRRHRDVERLTAALVRDRDPRSDGADRVVPLVGQSGRFVPHDHGDASGQVGFGVRHDRATGRIRGWSCRTARDPQQPRRRSRQSPPERGTARRPRNGPPWGCTGRRCRG